MPTSRSANQIEDSVKERTSEETSIAVIGIGTLFPGAIGNHGLWHSIVDREDLFTDVPVTHWLTDDYYDPDKTKPGKTYVRRGAFIGDTPFDPLEFGIPPSQLSAIDTAQLLALVVARRVLDEACHMEFTFDRPRPYQRHYGRLRRKRTDGIHVAEFGYPHWAKALREAGIPDEQAKAIVDRIRRQLPEMDRGGVPRAARQRRRRPDRQPARPGRHQLRRRRRLRQLARRADLAVQELAVGRLATWCVTGGVDTFNDIFMYMCFSKTPALSPSGDCRPFDARRRHDAGRGPRRWSCSSGSPTRSATATASTR